MGSEYKETTLGEFAPFKYGKGLPRKVRNLKGKIPVFGSNGIIDYHDTPLINGEGIIIGRKGSFGEVIFSKVPFWPIDTTFYIEKSPVSDIRFIYYLLKSLPLKDMNSDSAVPGLNRNAAHNLLVNIPPLEEQKRIAHILGTLDDKIELNARMNETLEAMARALFKAWFVDFEPVKAKIEGRPYPLPDKVMALFPDELVESELGLIPKGWRVGKLGDICSVGIGGDWGKEEEFPGSISARCLRGVDLEHLRLNGIADPPIRWFKQLSLEKRSLTNKEIIIAASGVGPLGWSIWFNDFLKKLFHQPITYSNFTKRLNVKTEMLAVYLDKVLYEMKISREIWEYSTGTAIPNLDIGGLLQNKRITIPEAEILRFFYEFMSKVYDTLYCNENNVLENIKTGLLSFLFESKPE